MKFHLPSPRQFRCLSGCMLMVLSVFGGLLLLLFALMSALPSLMDQIENNASTTVVELALDEVYVIAPYSLRLTAIEAQPDGSLDVHLDYFDSGLQIEVLVLSFQPLADTPAPVVTTPGDYLLRLLSAGEQSIRLQIIFPYQED